MKRENVIVVEISRPGEAVLDGIPELDGVQVARCPEEGESTRCFDELVHHMERPAAVLIGRIRQPLRLARRIHQADPLVGIIFAAAEPELRDLRRRMMFEAGAGCHWSIVPIDSELLPQAVLETAQSTHQRRMLRITRDRFNARLAEPPPAKPAPQRPAVSNRFLASVLDQSEDAIIALDADGVILSWNRGAADLFDLAEADALDEPFESLGLNEWPEEIPPLLRSVSLTRKTVRREAFCRRRDGRAIVVALTLGPVLDEGGRPIGFSAICRDVTERKWMEARQEFLARVGAELSANLELEQAFQNIARIAVPQIADFCMVSLVENGALRPLAAVHLNPEKAELAHLLAQRYPPRPTDPFGPGLILATRHAELLAPIRPEDLRDLAHSEEHLKGLRSLELRSWLAAPLQVGGRLLGVLCLGTGKSGRIYKETDLAFAQEFARRMALAMENSRLSNELRQAETGLRPFNEALEQRVAERTAELEMANQELETFSYSVAHDLRAPLRAMQGFADAIVVDYEPALDETGKDYLRRIRTACKRMDSLISDLLEYSRVSRLELELEPVDLNEVVDDALDEYRQEIQSRQARVVLAESLPIVRGNHPLLVQAVANLVSNALKFTRQETGLRLRIWSQEYQGRIRLWIEDNGIGIDSLYHDRIFKVFERLNDRRLYPGTGIGLAIVRKTVERLGGQSGVESTPGQGSRFWIELAAAGGEQPPAESSHRNPNS